MTEHFHFVRRWAKCFTYIIAFHLHKPLGSVLLASSSQRQKLVFREVKSFVPGYPLESGRAGFQMKAQLLNSCS